ETHHLLPSTWQPGSLALPQKMDRMVFVTVHPNQVSPQVLSAVDTVIAVGQAPEKTIGQFCDALKDKSPRIASKTLEAGEVLFWSRREKGAPFRLRVTPSRMERRRHSRKYAQGELPPERSFYFQGPDGKLNLRAQNLFLFLQLA